MRDNLWDDKFWEGMVEILDRRDLLFSHSPKCPKCGTKQVQCTEYLNTPAQWKCRECKHRFEYEYIK